MSLKVSINGFDRKARQILRELCGNANIIITGLNAYNYDKDNLIYLLEFDSVHRKFSECVSFDPRDSIMRIQHQSFTVYFCKKGDTIPWDNEMIIECTGEYESKSELESLFAASTRKVIPTYSLPGVPEYIYHINAMENAIRDEIVSASTMIMCTLTPVLAAIQGKFKILNVSFTHIYGCSEEFVASREDAKRNPLNSAGGFDNIIGESLDIERQIVELLPSFKGIVYGTNVKVPIAGPSRMEYLIEFEEVVSPEKFIDAIRTAENGNLSGIICSDPMTELPTDYINNIHSAIVDEPHVVVPYQELMKVSTMQDEESAYARQLANLIIYLEKYE